jgi:hypothetical protein
MKRTVLPYLMVVGLVPPLSPRAGDDGLLEFIQGMCAAAAAEDQPVRPQVEKLGTLACDMVEATPVAFGGRLYHFQYVRPDYKHKVPGIADSYFRFWDVEKAEPTPPFAHGFHLGSAHVETDTMYVYGVRNWGDWQVHIFWSKNLRDWQTKLALDLPGWGIFNNSVCKASGRYVMAFEIDKPADEAGVPFTTRFAESADLLEWKLLPTDHVFTRDRYDACPSIRFVDGWFYMTYLETRPGPTYETHIVRSRDLVGWESSPLNPVLVHSEEDRLIANPRLTPAERERIAKAVNRNASDVDFCEFQGRTIIIYSWGNQHGVEHLAHAVYDGPLDRFLKGFFQ